MGNLNVLGLNLPSSGKASGDDATYDLSYRGAAGERRQPVMMWTETRPTPIKFWVNPSECQWRMATRTMIEPIQGGAVHHEWDSTGVGSQNPQKFDQPVINFTFQSGLILPNGTNDSGNPDNDLNDVPHGLSNFYDFVEILNQPNVTATGTPNYVIITYVSSIFPALTLYGHFSSEGVQWTDTADQPNMVVGWGASFVVFFSTPSVFDSGILSQTYRDVYFK